MSAVGRVTGAPGLVLAVLVLHLAVAGFVGSAAGSAAAANLGKGGVGSNGALFYPTLELLIDHPGLFVAARQMLLGAGLAALVLWIAVAGAVLQRLDGPKPLERLAGASVEAVPGVLVVSLWHLPLRVVSLGVFGALAVLLMRVDSVGWLGLILLATVLGINACALDLARANVVLHGARRFHWKTALRGYAQAFKRPGVLGRSLVWSLLQWGTAVAAVLVAVGGFGTSWAAWPVRLLAAVGVVAGLIRLAVAVEAGPYLAAEPAQAPAELAPDREVSHGLGVDVESRSTEWGEEARGVKEDRARPEEGFRPGASGVS